MRLHKSGEDYYERHCILKEGLIYLGVDAETAEQDACRIEHDISREAFEKLKACYVFAAAWLGSGRKITPEEMALVMTDVLESNRSFAQLYGVRRLKSSYIPKAVFNG